MAAYTMVNAHTAAEKRFVNIKNVVINLESATIKWCQITKLLREKTEMGQKRKKYVFLVWAPRSGSNNSKHILNVTNYYQ
jgi:hypothetical protein